MSTAAQQRRRAAEELRAQLDEVQSGLEQQEQSVRAIKGFLHARSFSAASTLRASMAQVAPSVFYVKHARRFNQEFQDVCFDEKLDAFAKVEKLRKVIGDFEEEAGRVAVSFLNEYLGDEPAIEWAEKEDVAFGAAMSISILDCEDSSVVVARNEQNMQYLFLTQQLAHLEHPLVTVSPRTIVYYRGRALLVGSEVGPALATSGPGAGGDSTKIPELKAALNIINESCNLRKYYRLSDDGKEERIAGPPGVTAFRATDGRYYATGLVGLLPHFPPARGSTLTSDHSLFLRLEAVLDPRSERLSPGAFLCHGARDSAEGSRDVRACAATLCQSVVPALAAEFDSAPLAPSAATIVETMHQRGANVALLFMVYYHSTSTAVRSAVLTEMAARCLRDRIRAAMATRIDEEDIIEAVSELCASICNEDTAAATWQDEVVPRMIKKFPGFATLATGAADAKVGPISHASVNKAVLLRRVEALVGFTFAKGVTEKGTSAFHFSVQALGHVVKHFALPTFRLGSSVYMRIGMTSPPLSPQGLHPSTDALRARLNAVAQPSEVNVAEYLLKRTVISGAQGVDFAVACYEAIFLLRRAGLNDAAIAHADKCIEVATAASSALRKSMLVALARGQRGIEQIAKGAFAPAVKDLDLAIRQLTSSKPTAELSLESPPTNDDLANSLNSLSQLRSSVFIPSQPVSCAAASFARQLAQAYEDRGLREEAEPLYRQVLDTVRTVYGDVHPAVSSALNNLAVNLFSQEQFDEAESLYLEDLRISELLNGKDDLSVANTLNNLACLYDKLGRYSESETMYKRDIAISTAVLGEKHPDVATSRNNLASSYFQQGRLDEAEREYVIALNARTTYFGEKHVSVAESLNNIAALQRRQGKLDEARKTWDRALALYEQCVGPQHHSLAPVLENMQSLAEELGDVDRAEALMERAMDLKRAEAEIFHAQQGAVGQTGSKTSNRSA